MSDIGQNRTKAICPEDTKLEKVKSENMQLQ